MKTFIFQLNFNITNLMKNKIKKNKAKLFLTIFYILMQRVEFVLFLWVDAAQTLNIFLIGFAAMHALKSYKAQLLSKIYNCLFLHIGWYSRCSLGGRCANAHYPYLLCGHVCYGNQECWRMGGLYWDCESGRQDQLFQVSIYLLINWVCNDELYIHFKEINKQLITMKLD